jgi:2-dehydro-3-deoxyphosphogluconate aldolase / (4S)-4-hydroxy-2-oxoglutarate aldolase
MLTSEQAKMCLDMNTEFLVNPGLSVPALTTDQACGKPIRGGLPPPELMSAHEHRARLIKISPCANPGGPKYLKSLKVPFPNASLIRTGCVNASNAPDYLTAGAVALGVGADLVDVAARKDGNSAKIVLPHQNWSTP